jgi:hypothetical protein
MIHLYNTAFVALGTKGNLVRSRGRIVGGPQVVAWQFVLLTVVHATGSEGLPGLDVATSGSLSTLTATDEGERAKDEVTESHDTDGGDESDDKTLVRIVVARVEVTLHVTVDVAGRVGVGGVGVVGVVVSGGGVGVAIGSGGVGVGVVIGRVGRGPGRNVRLELVGGLTGTGDTTTFGAFLKSVGDVVRDL